MRCTTLTEVPPSQNFLATGGQLCDNYVMRSTRNVAQAEEGTGMVHYSDPPLLVLASLANGPKHGHAMIEDIVRLCGTRLGPGNAIWGDCPSGTAGLDQATPAR